MYKKNFKETIKNATLSIYDGMDTNTVLVSENEVEFMLHYAIAKSLEELGLWKAKNGGGFEIIDSEGHSIGCNHSNDHDSDSDDDDDDDDNRKNQTKKAQKKTKHLIKSFSSTITKVRF